MKRTLAVLGFSLVALGAHAVEHGPPFSQLDIDRRLPDIDFPPVEPYATDARATFMQFEIDRTVPNLSSEPMLYAEGGNTRTDASVDSRKASGARSPWADDHHFIAPPQ